MAAATKKKADESLPIAVSTQGGLLAALFVLLAGTAQGTRAWILLIKAGITFLLVSGILKLVTAGVMQAVRWKANAPPKPKNETSEEIEATTEAIRSTSRTSETTEKVPS